MYFAELPLEVALPYLRIVPKVIMDKALGRPSGFSLNPISSHQELVEEEDKDGNDVENRASNRNAPVLKSLPNSNINVDQSGPNSEYAEDQPEPMSPTIKKIKAKQFMALGYGVNAYFNTTVGFIKMFTVLSIMAIALMTFYKSFDGMKSLSGVSMTASWSIGNLGFSSVLCSPVSFGVEHNVINCPNGQITNIIDFGINPYSLKSKSEMKLGEKCITDSTNKCSGFLNQSTLNSTLMTTCIGKESCKISNFATYVKTDATSKASADYSSCTNDEAIFFT